MRLVRHLFATLFRPPIHNRRTEPASKYVSDERNSSRILAILRYLDLLAERPAVVGTEQSRFTVPDNERTNESAVGPQLVPAAVYS